MFKSVFFAIIIIMFFSGMTFLSQEVGAADNEYRVVYQSMVDEDFQIFMINMKDSSTSYQMTFGEHGSKHPTITENGKRVYYYHWTPTNWGDMELLYYQINEEYKERLVQRNLIHEEKDPSISRDGSTLAYSSNQAITTETGTMPETDNWEVVCVRTDFSEANRITQTIDEETAPCLNGNGDTVYFAITVERDRTEAEKEVLREEEEIRKEKEADAEKVDTTSISPKVLNNPFTIEWLDFNKGSKGEILMYPGMGGSSSTGPRLSESKDDDDDEDDDASDDEFEDSWDFNHFNVYYIFRNSFDGENLERVTARDYNAWHPSVDSDENWMVFASDMDGNDEIYVLDLESYDVQRLTENEAYDDNPQISHDGKYIVFVSDRDGDKEIFIMDRDGGNVKQLTNNEIEDDNPAIS